MIHISDEPYRLSRLHIFDFVEQHLKKNNIINSVQVVNKILTPWQHRLILPFVHRSLLLAPVCGIDCHRSLGHWSVYLNKIKWNWRRLELNMTWHKWNRFSRIQTVDYRPVQPWWHISTNTSTRSREMFEIDRARPSSQKAVLIALMTKTAISRSSSSKFNIKHASNVAHKCS